MTDNQLEKIRERFSLIRKTMKKTQKEFAELTGYKQGHISEMEKGSKNISKAIFYVLEDKLNVNRKWLETGEGEMFLNKVKQEDTEPNLNMNDSTLIKHLERTINAQEKLIASLENENERLRVDNDSLRSENQKLREQIIQSASGNKSQQAG